MINSPKMTLPIEKDHSLRLPPPILAVHNGATEKASILGDRGIKYNSSSLRGEGTNGEVRTAGNKHAQREVEKRGG